MCQPVNEQYRFLTRGRYMHTFQAGKPELYVPAVWFCNCCGKADSFAVLVSRIIRI